MRDTLERLDTLYPGLMMKFWRPRDGGRADRWKKAKFAEFQQRFGELVTRLA